MKALLYSFLIVLLWTGVAAADSNTFHSPVAGFAITKPESWQYMSTQDVMENRERVEMEDKSLQKLVRERANAPIVAFTRYGLDYDDLNPSVQVLLRPLGTLNQFPPTRLLHISVSGLKKAYRDFTFIEAIHETQVDGLAAATMKAQYTLTSVSGRRFAVLARMWVVPRGDYLFMIAMSGPVTGPNVSEKEFEQALHSIRIEK